MYWFNQKHKFNTDQVKFWILIFKIEYRSRLFWPSHLKYRKLNNKNGQYCEDNFSFKNEPQPRGPYLTHSHIWLYMISKNGDFRKEMFCLIFGKIVKIRYWEWKKECSKYKAAFVKLVTYLSIDTSGLRSVFFVNTDLRSIF